MKNLGLFGSAAPFLGIFLGFSSEGALHALILSRKMGRIERLNTPFEVAQFIFSYFVSIGNSMDVNFGDLIDYFGQDPNTKSIVTCSYFHSRIMIGCNKPVGT